MKRLHWDKNAQGVAATTQTEARMIEAADGFKERGKALVRQSLPIIAGGCHRESSRALPSGIPQSRREAGENRDRSTPLGTTTASRRQILDKLQAVCGNGREAHSLCGRCGLRKQSTGSKRAMKTAESSEDRSSCNSRSREDNVHEDEIGVGGIDPGEKTASKRR